MELVWFLAKRSLDTNLRKGSLGGLRSNTTTLTPFAANSLAINSPIPLEPPVINTISWLLTKVDLLVQLLSAMSETLLLTLLTAFKARQAFRVRMKVEEVTYW